MLLKTIKPIIGKPLSITSLRGMRTANNMKSQVPLEDHLIKKDPIAIFESWFQEAKNNPQVIQANAMCLATATKDGIPSARYIICKEYGKDGFKFFTYYTSRKGEQLAENPNAALTFFWAPLSRTVRIEGVVEKLPMSEAEICFKDRPYTSQIGALCSDQSKPIESMKVLSDKEQELKGKFKEGEVPKPEFWGGYILKPKMIEFWQGHTDRIHDRIAFFKQSKEPDNILTHQAEDGWVYQYLAP